MRSPQSLQSAVSWPVTTLNDTVAGDQTCWHCGQASTGRVKVMVSRLAGSGVGERLWLEHNDQLPIGRCFSHESESRTRRMGEASEVESGAKLHATSTSNRLNGVLSSWKPRSRRGCSNPGVWWTTESSATAGALDNLKFSVVDETSDLLLVSSGVAVGRGVRNVAILKNIGFCYWSTGPCLQS